MNQHIVTAYEEELNQLTAETARMGGLVEAQVADSITAVARRDVTLAQQVVARDLRLDELQADIERRAIKLIALRQPWPATCAAPSRRSSCRSRSSAPATWPRTSPSVR
jgi:phosphate transport system protein